MGVGAKIQVSLLLATKWQTRKKKCGEKGVKRQRNM